jgi:hypothetical protein
MYILAQIMGTFDFSLLRPIPLFLDSKKQERKLIVVPDEKETGSLQLENAEQARTVHSSQLGEEYFANDGVVPVISQWHPLSCSETHCKHHGLQQSSSSSLLKIEPGRWDVHEIPDASHSAIVPFWTGNEKQRMFWEDLGDWLRAVEKYNAGRC